MKSHGVNSQKNRTANYDCGLCLSTFKRSSSVFLHLREIHNCKYPLKCVFCCSVFSDRESQQQHISKTHDLTRFSNSAVEEKPIDFQAKQHAIKKFFQSYRMSVNEQMDLLALMEFASLIKPTVETRVSCHAAVFQKLS